jgi:hypothetical protein
MYHARPGTSDSTELVRLVVDSGSLIEHHDGTPLAVGDSVRLTLAVVDTTRLVVEFQPVGLRLAPAAPARLRLGYAETDPDLDFDGTVDDDEMEASLIIGRQEMPLDPFEPVASQVDTVTDQVRIDIGRFARYALMH